MEASTQGSNTGTTRAGYFIHETSGSHVHLKHRSKSGRVTVPAHHGFDLPQFIVKSIIRQAGLTNAEFESLLGL